MPQLIARTKARNLAMHRLERFADIPQNEDGSLKKVSEYYGEHSFSFEKSTVIPKKVKDEVEKIGIEGGELSKSSADVIAKAVTQWAVSRGATHFCHWFQPLTGSTAEKHDAFLTLVNDKPLEKLSGSQLIKGEPDASSFPHGGSRSTFEARGYTAWDTASPFFIQEGTNGKTLCIPTAFVSYHGNALDIKTPLIRSNAILNKEATRFLKLLGDKSVKKVRVTCGAEQEYFLIDKAFYYMRPDLVMTGRTLVGSLPPRNQQLEDHYFGTIPDRVESFMQELEIELYKIGVPAKTRHNEVAPGQFEMAPIFEEANVANDHNQLTMATLKTVANKHDFVALLHEKPFSEINGSGKHLNWSMMAIGDEKENLLEPGNSPHTNKRFLALISIISEAVYRHAGAMRMSIAGHGNDHRLGANEAPPSIISIFLGDTITEIMDAIVKGEAFEPGPDIVLKHGANQLMGLRKDNTDRNRTSPFAFTGNKFEFRALGSSANIGFPMTVLNAAVSDVLKESNDFIEEELKKGGKISDVLQQMTKKWMTHAQKVIFNGDGYCDEWLEEAAKRGLPNLKNTVESLAIMKDSQQMAFLAEQDILNGDELEARHNILLERFVKYREIEFGTLINLVDQNVLPAAFTYKKDLSLVIAQQKQMGIESSAEVDIYKRLNFLTETLYAAKNNLDSKLQEPRDDETQGQIIVDELFPLSEQVASICNDLEKMVPDKLWDLPKYYDMLFVR